MPSTSPVGSIQRTAGTGTSVLLADDPHGVVLVLQRVVREDREVVRRRARPGRRTRPCARSPSSVQVDVEDQGLRGHPVGVDAAVQRDHAGRRRRAGTVPASPRPAGGQRCRRRGSSAASSGRPAVAPGSRAPPWCDAGLVLTRVSIGGTCSSCQTVPTVTAVRRCRGALTRASSASWSVRFAGSAARPRPGAGSGRPRRRCGPRPSRARRPSAAAATGAARDAAVEGLDRDPGTPGEHVVEVAGALVGDGVDDLGGEVVLGALERQRQRRAARSTSASRSSTRPPYRPSRWSIRATCSPDRRASSTRWLVRVSQSVGTEQRHPVGDRVADRQVDRSWPASARRRRRRRGPSRGTS